MRRPKIIARRSMSLYDQKKTRLSFRNRKYLPRPGGTKLGHSKSIDLALMCLYLTMDYRVDFDLTICQEEQRWQDLSFLLKDAKKFSASLPLTASDWSDTL